MIHTNVENLKLFCMILGLKGHLDRDRMVVRFTSTDLRFKGHLDTDRMVVRFTSTDLRFKGSS